MIISKKINYISLFSGCGGFDVGFKENGFECLGAYDIDPHVSEVHSKNLACPVFIHDLNDINLPGLLPNKIDVVISGSPCQGFSTIGKRKFKDPRNQLLLTGGIIAIKYHAKVFVSENVLGSNSGKHKKYWTDLDKLFKKNGYETKMVKYRVEDFGLPQLRKRIIFYAWKLPFLNDVDFLLPDKKNIILKDILSGMERLKNHNLNFIKDENDLIVASKIKPGQKLCNVRGGQRSVHTWHIPDVFGETTTREEELLFLVMKLRRQIRRRANGDADPVEKKIIKTYFNGETKQLVSSLLNKAYIKEVGGKHIDLRNTFNGKFRRLDFHSMSPTVDTRFGSYKHFIHPVENRSLSVREAARIQGFDDTFIFYGPIQKQYQMVGNAVPPPLSSFIAKNIRERFISGKI